MVVKGRTRAKISNQTVISLAKSPTGGPQTIDPYFTGPNILTDPGFENFVDNSGGWHHLDRSWGGSTTYTLPLLTVNCPTYLYLPGLTCMPEALIAWAQLNGPYTINDLTADTGWKVTISNPHSGDYHAIWLDWISNSIPGEIVAFSPFISAPHSARVNPGDTVTWSAYLMITDVRGTPQTFPYLQFFNSSGSAIWTTLGTATNLTTTYAQVSMNVVAPAGSHYVRAVFGFQGDGFQSIHTYFDTASLGIQP